MDLRLGQRLRSAVCDAQVVVVQPPATPVEVTDAGSDRLVDAVVAWGDVDAIRSRVQTHLDAGASDVCIQARGPMATSCVKSLHAASGSALKT
jgi:hypothetical protein